MFCNELFNKPLPLPLLRFLWRDSTDSGTETYQYQRHIFGAKCAPTCANYALCTVAVEDTKFGKGRITFCRQFGISRNFLTGWNLTFLKILCFLFFDIVTFWRENDVPTLAPKK
jgi:hypothetical protein